MLGLKIFKLVRGFGDLHVSYFLNNVVVYGFDILILDGTYVV